ncbi:MAG: hypothetical protein M9962_13835 [Oligoflexia bacterium]|nr:hypothetical protein [Oligoflexia bacterium]
MEKNLIRKINLVLNPNNSWIRRLGYFSPILLLFLSLSVVTYWVQQDYWMFVFFLFLSIVFFWHAIVSTKQILIKNKYSWRKYAAWQFFSLCLTIFVWARPVILNLFFPIK